MTIAVSVILIASASSDEELGVERALATTGRRVRCIRDTAEAERVCAENGGASILVIDSVLLEAPRDAGWRDLRTRHPALSAIVRCPISRDEIQRTDHNTLRVHQSNGAGNGAGICDAVDLLDSYRLGGMPAAWTKHVTIRSGTR